MDAEMDMEGEMFEGVGGEGTWLGRLDDGSS
jgi:hypothetical protein